MNPISNCYTNKENKTNEVYAVDCNDKFKNLESGKVLLRSSNGIFYPRKVNFITSNIPVNIDVPIASITIDKTCLNKPTTLIDFSGTLTALSTVAPVTSTLLFTLFKICKGFLSPIPLTTFTFSIINGLNRVPDSRNLKFEYSYCDDLCNECCTYTLMLTSISNFYFGSIEFTIIGNLSALAVESNNKL